jgi:dihydrodipicolinate reductase
VPCVVGTSGWDTEPIARKAEDAGVAVFYAPNFAIGAVLMMRFAAEASKHMPRAEIVELHHETKLDAPSGTAKATADAMEGDTPIHSVRLPGIVAHQEVLLSETGQLLTIRHDAFLSRGLRPRSAPRLEAHFRASARRDDGPRSVAERVILRRKCDEHGSLPWAHSRP